MSAALRVGLSTLLVTAGACASVEPIAPHPAILYTGPSTGGGSNSGGPSALPAASRKSEVGTGVSQSQAMGQPPLAGDPVGTRSAAQPASLLPRSEGAGPWIEDSEEATRLWMSKGMSKGMSEGMPGEALPANLGRVDAQNEGSVTFNNGVRFHFPSTSTKVHIGALIQQDWVFFGQDGELEAVPSIGDLENAVFFRRARVKFDGTTHGLIEWDFDAELLASSNVAFDDLWVGFKDLPGIGNLRAGHIKLPQGLESITSNRVFTFLERSAQHDAFYREYGPGVMIFDNWGGDQGQWSIAVHRQDPNGDGVSVGDGELATTGRLTAIPYSSDDDEQLVHVGVSASYRAAMQGVVRYRARPEFRIARQTPRFVDTGPIVADDALVIGTEAALVQGPLSMQAEYTAASALGREATTPGGPDSDPWFHGGFIQVSYFLTGEHRPYDRRLARMGTLKPTRSVSAEDRFSGAWELAARGTLVDLNDSDVRGGQLDAWTFGVNWYLSAFFRTQLNYVLTNRDAPDGEGTAHSIMMRFSLNL